MERLNVAGHLTPDEVFRRYRDCADGRVKSRWHALWLMVRPDGPVSAEQAAATVGLSDVWARKLVHRYNGRGPDSLADGRAGNRSKPKLDEARQAELFETLKDEPPDGGLRAGPKLALYVSARWGL